MQEFRHAHTLLRPRWPSFRCPANGHLRAAAAPYRCHDRLAKYQARTPATAPQRPLFPGSAHLASVCRVTTVAGRFEVAMYPAAQPLTQLVAKEVPVPYQDRSRYGTTLMPGATAS